MDQDEIDINMPFKSLKTNKLQLVKKIFADDPEFSTNEIHDDRLIYDPESLEDSKHLLNPSYIQMDDAQASIYEEFEVTKIKYSGERQIRILGISQFSIFNKYKEKQEGGYLHILMKILLVFWFLNIFFF